MRTVQDLWGSLADPIATFRRIADTPRALAAVTVLAVLNLALPWAVGPRLDARQSVVAKLGPELADLTDRDVDDAVTKAEKLTTALMVVGAVAAPPFRALVLSLALWLWARFLFRQPKFGTLYVLCVYAQVPLTVRSLASAVAAWGQKQLSPAQVETLLPSNPSVLWQGAPAVTRLLTGADFFLLWTAVLLGIALWVASAMPARRAVLGMGVAYLAYVAVFLVGLPGLLGG